MKRSVLAGIAVLALIMAVIILFFVLTCGNATSDKEIPGMGNPDYMLTGSDDTLYFFNGDNISAVSSDGRLKYTYVVPDGWTICHRWCVDTSQNDNKIISASQIVAEDDGILYVYLKPVDSPGIPDWNDSSSIAFYGTGKLLALGPDGLQLWATNVTSLMVWLSQYQPTSQYWTLTAASDTNVQARKGFVYVFHGYNESVYAENGTLLWTIADVSDPGTVDEAGNVYLMDAIQPLPMNNLPTVDQDLEAQRQYRSVSLSDYRIPGSVVDSYYPNGTQRWRQYSADPARRQYLDRTGTPPLPLYNNGIVYVLSDRSVTAIGSNGSKLWVNRFDKNNYQFFPSDSGLSGLIPPEAIQPESYQGGNFLAYWFMPFDKQGNLYIIYPLVDNRWLIGGAAYIIKISPDGSIVSSQKVKTWDFQVVGDNIGYNPVIDNPAWGFGSGRTLDNLSTGTLCAFDPGTDERLWNFTVPTDRRITMKINESNFNNLIQPGDVSMLDNLYNSSRRWGDLSSTVQPSGGVYGGVYLFGVYPGKGVVYVDFRTRNYEYPIVFNQSRYVYSGGVYAIGNNGTLLWSVPISPDTSVISASNSTIIYNTWDGKTYAKAIGAIAGGVALVSGAYLVFYFLAGTVTRARGRLDKNGNRTGVFRYISENPGSTLYEIARGTGLNIGTVRYHLFILGANHRIVAHEAGEKFVRYFTNAGTYSDRERTVISLLRRDVTGKVLRLIAEQPGIGNAEIARALGIHESIAHRSVKELLDEGLLTREVAGRGYANSLKAEDRELVLLSIEKLARAPGKDGITPGL